MTAANDWDALRQINEERLSRPRFQWTPQRLKILAARAHELETGETVDFGKPSDGGFSDEWKRRQLAMMRRHMQAPDDAALIAACRAEGMLP